VELTESDAGAERSVDVGQELVVRLPENRTTGYRWQLSVPEGGLALDDDTYEPDASERPGSGGMRTFRLRAIQPGTHQLGAALRRSWESDDAGRTVQFTVRAG
jgi:predicted secreted protein